MAVHANQSKPQTQIDSSAAQMLGTALAELGDDSISGESDAGSTSLDSDDSEPVDPSAGEDELAELNEGPGEGEEGEEESEGEGEEESEGEEAAEGTDAKASKKGAIEELEVTDETGRHKLKVDWNDKAKIKRWIQQAAGARKLYGQLQAAKQAAATNMPEQAKVAVERWDKLETLFKDEGVEGVVKLLSGKDFDTYASERAKMTSEWAKNPAAREAWEAKRAHAAALREAAQAKEEVKKLGDAARAEREAAEVSRLEAVAHTEFSKVRFAGKLGDPAREQRVDTMIWNSVQSELERLADQGVEPTAATMRQLYREFASTFGPTTRKAADKETQKAVQRRRKEATTAAQSASVRSEAKTRKQVDGDIDMQSTRGMADLMFQAMKSGRRQK